MEDPHTPIARYLRERRESAGLTRAALSGMAGISPALIQKIEQGTRTPTLEALTALFDALEVPDLFRSHILMLSISHRYDTPQPSGEVPAADLTLLHAIPFPASFQVYASYDILATNAAWDRHYPGLTTGTTLLEWMLLDPRSREALVDWREQVHLCVYGFRVMSRGVVPQRRIDELVATCAHAPEWTEFWTTEPATPASLDAPVLRIRDPETGAPTRMTMHNLGSTNPRRDWALIVFSPAPCAPE